MEDAGRLPFAQRQSALREPHGKQDGHSHRDVENVFILTAVRRSLLLLGTAVQVEDVDLVEGRHQGFAHAAVSDAVDVAVVGDEADNAVAGLLDTPLGKPDELDEVVVEVQLLLVQVLFIVVEQAENPLVAVHPSEVGVGRIAQDNHDGQLSLDLGGGIGLLGNPVCEKTVAAPGGLLQGVREEDAEPLVGAETVAGLLQLHAQFKMGNGIRRHEDFKAEQPVQQVFLHIAVPLAALTGKPGENMGQNKVKECGGPDGGIEDERMIVGQPIGTVEPALQQPVHRPHNILDHRFRGVTNTALVAHLGVVDGKESFIEVNDRIFLALALAEVPQDLRHVRMTKQIYEVLDGPGNGIRHVHTGDFGKKFAKEGIRFGQSESRHFTGELPVRGGVNASGKEAVGQRLRKHVGKLGFFEVGDQRLPESRQPVVQPRGTRRHDRAIGFPGLFDELTFGLFGFVLERGNDQIADDPRRAGHVSSKLPGRTYGQSRFVVEGGQKLFEFLAAVRQGPDAFLAIDICNSDGQTFLSRCIPAKLKVIGENPVRQRRIPFELVSIGSLAAFHLVKTYADVLCLNMTDRNSLPGDVEIGRAAGYPAGFVRGVDIFSAGFQKRL